MWSAVWVVVVVVMGLPVCVLREVEKVAEEEEAKHDGDKEGDGDHVVWLTRCIDGITITVDEGCANNNLTNSVVCVFFYLPGMCGSERDAILNNNTSMRVFGNTLLLLPPLDFIVNQICTDPHETFFKRR